MIGTAISLGNLLFGARNASKANKLTKESVNMAKQQYKDTGPARAIALQRLRQMGQLQAPNLSATFADPSNPFYAARNKKQG
jgi:hypothetical protein